MHYSWPWGCSRSFYRIVATWCLSFTFSSLLWVLSFANIKDIWQKSSTLFFFCHRYFLVLHLRTYYLTQIMKISMFASKSFIALALTFSLWSILNCFWVWCEVNSHLYSFASDSLFSQDCLLKRLVLFKFSWHTCLNSSKERCNSLSLDFQFFSTDPYVLILITQCLHYYRFVVIFEIGKCEFISFILLQ